MDELNQESILMKLVNPEDRDAIKKVIEIMKQLPLNTQYNVECKNCIHFDEAQCDDCVVRVRYEPKPQRLKKGHWILDDSDNSITCDKCGCLIYANDILHGDAHFCPNCGADMRGEKC